MLNILSDLVLFTIVFFVGIKFTASTWLWPYTMCICWVLHATYRRLYVSFISFFQQRWLQSSGFSVIISDDVTHAGTFIIITKLPCRRHGRGFKGSFSKAFFYLFLNIKPFLALFVYSVHDILYSFAILLHQCVGCLPTFLRTVRGLQSSKVLLTKPAHFHLDRDTFKTISVTFCGLLY